MANESWRLENHGEYYETNFFSRKWQFRNLVLCGISLDKEPSGVRLIQKLYGSHHAWPTRQKLGWRKCKLIFETEGVSHALFESVQVKDAPPQKPTRRPAKSLQILVASPRLNVGAPFFPPVPLLSHSLFRLLSVVVFAVSGFMDMALGDRQTLRNSHTNSNESCM